MVFPCKVVYTIMDFIALLFTKPLVIFIKLLCNMQEVCLWWLFKFNCVHLHSVKIQSRV